MLLYFSVVTEHAACTSKSHLKMQHAVYRTVVVPNLDGLYTVKVGHSRCIFLY
jgi:hypothetical protein